MTITFTITKKELWRFHPHANFRNPIPVLLRLLWLPILVFGASCIGGLDWVRSLEIAALISLLPLIAWGGMIAGMVQDVSKSGLGGQRIAEIGKFDFRYGKPQTPGYYYHWTDFSAINETPDGLYFTLKHDRQIIIPRTAFKDEDEVQRFLTLAIERWKAAERNRHFSADVIEGVWPPPPWADVK